MGFKQILVTLDGSEAAQAALNYAEKIAATIRIDHDIVDNAPPARFAQCYTEPVESDYGLCSK